MRQLPLYVLTVLVAMTLVYAFVAPFEGALDRPAPAGDTTAITPEDFELPDEMQNEQDDAPAEQQESSAAAPKSARTVKPDLMSPSIGDATPLQRIAPRDPLSDLGQALPPKPPAPPEPPAPPPPPVPVDDTAKPTLLYRPVATSAGALEASGYRIALDGIDATGPEQTCTTEGATWPCGMAARTAFRNWLRLRAVECTVPGQPPEAVVETQCKLGGVDLAQWLVENGWARAKDGSPMAESMKKAEEAKLGIFGGPPPALPEATDLPLPTFSDEAPEEPPPLPVPDAPFPPRPQ